jgi:peptidoglycan/xylan/chitin deacetylase (PgdA/CDA1 family)
VLVDRKRVARAVRKLAYWSGLSAARARRQAGARVLMFHGVGGVDTPLRGFEDQLRYLKRHFSVVSLDAVCDWLAGRCALPPRAVVLTFDDGLRSNFREAYPLLAALGLPAVFYVCPGLIEERRWLWNHEARERLRHMEPRARQAIAARLGAANEPGAGVERLKGLRKPERRAAEQAIRDASPDFVATPELRAKLDPMGWEELRALDPRLVTVGSHTVSHDLLDSLAPAEAEYEIAESRRWLERELGREVRHFSYPNGRHDETAVALVRRHYASAASVEPRLVGRDADPHRIPRIFVEAEPESLAWRLHRPAV